MAKTAEPPRIYPWYHIGYRWFCVRLWWHRILHDLAWRLAWLLPREVALMAYVRVSGCSGDVPRDYDRIYKLYESGVGR